MVEFFAKIVNGLQPLAIFPKSFIIVVSYSPKYAFEAGI